MAKEEEEGAKQDMALLLLLLSLSRGVISPPPQKVPRKDYRVRARRRSSAPFPP